MQFILLTVVASYATNELIKAVHEEANDKSKMDEILFGTFSDRRYMALHVLEKQHRIEDHVGLMTNELSAR